ncbi:RNA-directed DNA polymerase-like protein [Gossypium australe]|uniref:RNA-directed DNA polymerase-like protein n=1 Tax=Gossypium australe TaxID=47621 RepID=A0A5B6VCI2_9ROSI|nr:RNA-directed DNA polymerase-like protein [Gossypium australe]
MGRGQMRRGNGGGRGQRAPSRIAVRFDFGMDWLVEHQVGLDCDSQRVTFKVGDDVEVVMVGQR